MRQSAKVGQGAKPTDRGEESEQDQKLLADLRQEVCGVSGCCDEE